MIELFKSIVHREVKGIKIVADLFCDHLLSQSRIKNQMDSLLLEWYIAVKDQCIQTGARLCFNLQSILFDIYFSHNSLRSQDRQQEFQVMKP
jgi:hypothetical protein